MKQGTQYIGILLGALYGLLMRMIGEIEKVVDFYNIYSISFLWITPMIIGLFPIIFSSNEIYKSKIKLFFYPILTIILFFIIAFLTKMEDLVCLLIIGLPFFIAAGIIGILLGAFIKGNVKNKRLYTVIILPLLLNPIESLLPNQKATYHVSSEIIIDKSQEAIFPHLLEVPTLTEKEYTNGFYQAIGIPRPVYSKMFKEDNQWYRIGHFTENLKLYEYVSEIKSNEFVNFKIDLAKSQLRATPTDQHLLRSNYFKFENINYTLIKLSENQTKIILNCDYKITSKMNFYANFWATNIIQDFEQRLLHAIKIKLEQNNT